MSFEPPPGLPVAVFVTVAIPVCDAFTTVMIQESLSTAPPWHIAIVVCSVLPALFLLQGLGRAE